ncbi:MAG: acyl-CoA dehydrogenase [Desulfobacteraceae bacterium]|nr:acyl-CoA dehydrogenase [Desulfobacteraceae bacterium]
MNYDFTKAEFKFFQEIEKKLDSLADIEKLETRDTSGGTRYISRVMETLANTPYLKLGIEPVEGLHGFICLMGAMEIFAGFSPSACLSIEASARLFARAVSLWGTREQKELFLAPVLEGKAIGALALPGESMNIENHSLSASGKRKERSVTVNGEKKYVINAPVADWIAVAGLLDDRYVLFIVERDTAGLMIDPSLETAGYQGAPISGITLEDCEIPSGHVTIPPSGSKMPEVLRTAENLIFLGTSLGLSKTAFDAARQYAKSHHTCGKPIIAYQEIGFKLAEMLTLLQTSQLLAYRAAWALETASDEADELILCAKVFCSEACEQICSEGLKILGGEGYISGNRAERAYRCAKYGQIAGTSTEIARVRLGDAALGYRK